MTARALACPNCGGPTRFRVPFCAYCRHPLTWTRVPDLSRGEPIFRDHYPAAELLGRTQLVAGGVERVAQGWAMTVQPQAGRWAFTKMETRDVSLCVTATALDRDALFGAVVRAHAEGSILDAYVAVVVPGYRSVRLSRIIEGGEVGKAKPIVDWRCSPHVRTPGEVNALELRCADSILQVYVNGERVIDVEHTGIGFGAVGWRAGSLAPDHGTTPSRIVFHALEAFETVT